jgi:hypothetical protein
MKWPHWRWQCSGHGKTRKNGAMSLYCTRIEYTLDPQTTLQKRCCLISWILWFGTTSMNTKSVLNGTTFFVCQPGRYIAFLRTNRLGRVGCGLGRMGLPWCYSMQMEMGQKQPQGLSFITWRGAVLLPPLTFHLLYGSSGSVASIYFCLLETLSTLLLPVFLLSFFLCDTFPNLLFILIVENINSQSEGYSICHISGR